MFLLVGHIHKSWQTQVRLAMVFPFPPPSFRQWSAWTGPYLVITRERTQLALSSFTTISISGIEDTNTDNNWEIYHSQICCGPGGRSPCSHSSPPPGRWLCLEMKLSQCWAGGFSLLKKLKNLSGWASPHKGIKLETEMWWIFCHDLSPPQH